MSFEVSDRIHIAPLGIEHDRIVHPAVATNADHVVLLEYLPDHFSDLPPDDQIETDLQEKQISCERRDYEIDDLFDALAAFGRVITEHDSDTVYVNLATGNKIMAISGMIACMTTGTAQPYYVEAEQHGSHQPPAPSGVRSVETLPHYPMERPERQHLAVMDCIATSEKTTAEGEPYRIKRDLFEFGEELELPFIAEYTGDTDKGKFRLLDAHIISPLQETGYLTVENVGTQKRVMLTEDGQNTLRAFRYLID